MMVDFSDQPVLWICFYRRQKYSHPCNWASNSRWFLFFHFQVPRNQVGMGVLATVEPFEFFLRSYILYTLPEPNMLFEAIPKGN